MKIITTLFAASLAFTVCTACSDTGTGPAADTHTSDAPQASETDTNSDIRASIEAEIVPAITIVGETRPTLVERMAHFRAPQVSVAVWRDGTLDWAQGYGEGADADTLFQAASLSKAVSATGIVTLAMKRGVSLDDDISDQLDGLDLAALNPDGVPITLRGLLSHTNGATVGGFPGYAAGEPLPTNLEVITGTGTANTEAVRIEANPDGNFSYAGGGFQLAQYWAESVSGEDFAVLMDRLVLEPVGMTQSTFEMPPPETWTKDGNVAPAYDFGGEPIEGGWHTYPELAAAGLWTTPTDYGRFAVALSKAMTGETGTGIDVEVAREVTTPVSEGYGLGIGTREKDGEIILSHSGSNMGYKTYFEAWPGRGDAIVVMTGAQGGFPLVTDIVRTAKLAYGHSIKDPRQEARFDMADETLAALAGDYWEAGDDQMSFTLQANSPDMILNSRQGGRYRLVPIGEALLIDPDDGETLTFAEKDGVMTITTGGADYVQVRKDP
ncbi:serine hydrolase domain-containing protein [Henriciella sp. AS95]|uniref:serine hydrolase domain-containing protein n=1 Tax=Henriciella sp. AS95 TaxID=3135782 RepID=UPI003180FB98